MVNKPDKRYILALFSVFAALAAIPIVFAAEGGMSPLDRIFSTIGMVFQSNILKNPAAFSGFIRACYFIIIATAFVFVTRTKMFKGQEKINVKTANIIGIVTALIGAFAIPVEPLVLSARLFGTSLLLLVMLLPAALFLIVAFTVCKGPKFMHAIGLMLIGASALMYKVAKNAISEHLTSSYPATANLIGEVFDWILIAYVVFFIAKFMQMAGTASQGGTSLWDRVRNGIGRGVDDVGRPIAGALGNRRARRAAARAGAQPAPGAAPAPGAPAAQPPRIVANGVIGPGGQPLIMPPGGNP